VFFNGFEKANKNEILSRWYGRYIQMNSFDPEPKETTVHCAFDTEHQTPTLFYKDKDILILDNVLSEKECKKIRDFIDAEEETLYPSWSQKGTKKKLIRHWDDMPLIPITGKKYINPCWRFVRASHGSKQSLHYDGKYIKSLCFASVFTVLIYLSSHSDGELVFSDSITVKPREGRMVIFNQNLLHEAKVNQGTKYLVRSEIMEERDYLETEEDKQALLLYQEAVACFYTHPEKSKEYEKKAFILSPSLEKLVYD
jgi:hypothetical protein